MFDSPAFKKFSADLEAAMEDSKRAPSLNCPACDQRMIHVIGSSKLSGYSCHGFDCVGIDLTVEDLSDAERYKIVVDECLGRKQRFADMRTRNGWTNQPDRKTMKYCSECRGWHVPSAEHPICKLCSFGIHAPMPEDIYFDFKGWRFRPPFHCMCCGMEICHTQWAYGRYCGTCDTGHCRTKHLHEFRDGVFCGPNTEPIDPKEADYYRFTPERMRMVPPAKPMEWRKPDHSIPGYTSGDLNP